jgi:hypothetical protein
VGDQSPGYGKFIIIIIIIIIIVIVVASAHSDRVGLSYCEGGPTHNV